MKIEHAQPVEPRVHFGTLNRGDTFLWGDTMNVYMRTDTVGKVNAVNLLNSNLSFFSMDDEVQKIEAKVVVA